MSKVITFSTVFPSYHPKAGQVTNFPAKIIKSLWSQDDSFSIPKWACEMFSQIEGIKHHTIRAGSRWKVGAKFSPRIWTGTPRRSKQFCFAPDIEIKQIWDIEIDIRDDFQEICMNPLLAPAIIKRIAENDGLLLEDFLSWFNKPFVGQVICWSDSVTY